MPSAQIRYALCVRLIKRTSFPHSTSELFMGFQFHEVTVGEIGELPRYSHIEFGCMETYRIMGKILYHAALRELFRRRYMMEIKIPRLCSLLQKLTAISLPRCK